MSNRLMRRRLGVAVAIALTMIAVTGLLLGVMLQHSVREHRQLRMSWNEWQARWLARAAAERAQVQLATGDDYNGEHWQPEFASHLPDVQVEVEKTANGQRQLAITANYPSADSPQRARVTLRPPLRTPSR